MTLASQADLFSEPPPRERTRTRSGAELRDEALALHERAQPGYLERAREAAFAIYRETGRPVNIDQVRERVGNPPEGKSPTVNGSVFNRGSWVPVGDVNSGRSVCHTRRVRTFVPRKKETAG
jgi:hypothetical protein